MNSGIYIRVDKKNMLLEQMTEEQRMEWLKTLSTEGLIRTVNILANVLQYIETETDRLDLEGDYDDYIE